MRDVVSATAPSLWMGRRSGHSRRGRAPRCDSVRSRLGRNLHAGKLYLFQFFFKFSSFYKFLINFDATLCLNVIKTFNCCSMAICFLLYTELKLGL